ncbi:MAG: right-handed parallel beta-helix repeat-containing protein, partial [Chloroflexota bacterium]|nr:right-handed parallel beta-helix repeat-containing protein [Chloroflexota bacterium]
MDARARQTLSQLLAAHGRALCEDPRRVEALLRDLCGECRKEVFVLVSALRERVVVDLLAWPAGVPQELLLARLSARLADDLGFSPEVARWAVETWAAALAEIPSPDGLPLTTDLALTHLARGAAAPGDVALADHASDRPPPSARGVGQGPLRLPVAPGGVLRVASEPGRADFTSIATAVRHAEPGMRVEVSPGVYAEGIVLDRLVEIVPAPPAAPVQGDMKGDTPDSRPEGQPQGLVVVEAMETSCLRMETAYAVVRGIVLRGRAGPEHRTRFAVDVPQGQLLLEDCDLTSDALACVAVRGRTANPVLRRCHVHDGKGSGVFVHHGGRATLEDCAIV